MSLKVNDYENAFLRHQTVFGADNSVSASMKMPEPIESIADKIEEIKEREHNKRAITIGGIVIGVMLTVMLLNPKYSTKLAQRLKAHQTEISKKISETKNSKFVNKIYDMRLQVTQAISSGVNFFNNVNPYKDTIFKNLCTKEKEFNFIKDVKIRNKVVNVNNKIVKVTSKIYNGITKAFDSISKLTVKQSYKKSLKKLDELENFLIQKSAALSKTEKNEIEAKLKEIAAIRSNFSEEAVANRINAQEGYMADISSKFMDKFERCKSDLISKGVKKGDYLVKNLYYWPEEILKPSRDKIEKEGVDRIEKLIGDGKGKNGLYNDIIAMVSRNLNNDEQKALDNMFKKADKALRTANHNECIEYFDKKRDLVLGSAPTDIVTAVVSLTAAGIAIASADEKQKRLSRLVTGVIPTLAGVGVSIGMAAALVSGAKGLLIGLAAAAVLNRLGILFDKYILGNREYDEENRKVHENHKRKKDKKVKEAKVNV